jgi:hypothetical protein
MYVLVTKSPGMTLDDYRTVRGLMGDEPPAGQVSHHVGEREGSLCTADVWDSQASADRFAAERLFPAFAQAGVAPTADAIILTFETADALTG